MLKMISSGIALAVIALAVLAAGTILYYGGVKLKEMNSILAFATMPVFSPPPLPSLTPLPCSDPRANCVTVIPATLLHSCAPWVGPAVELRFRHEGQFFRAYLISDGLTRLIRGESVTINDSSDADTGTGHAVLCENERDNPKKDCATFEAGVVTIENPAGLYQEDAPLRFNVKINNAVVPVEAIWDGEEPECSE